jgi:hypothetical protein
MIDLQRLEAGVTYIEDHPEQHQQDLWIGSKDTIEHSTSSWCGTVGCLFGWVVLLNGDLPVDANARTPLRNADDLANSECGETSLVTDGHVLIVTVAERAHELLGMTKAEGDWWSQGGRTVEEMRAAVDAMKAGADSPRFPEWE